jgi:hypothetical protein
MQRADMTVNVFEQNMNACSFTTEDRGAPLARPQEYVRAECMSRIVLLICTLNKTEILDAKV